MNELTITIVEDTSFKVDEDGDEVEEQGFQYHIYDCVPDEDTDDIDGGFCSGSLSDALDMAVEQAKALMVEPCRACGGFNFSCPACKHSGE